MNATTSAVSPAGEYVVTGHSRIGQVPVTELLDRDGNLLLELEQADLSGMPDGWDYPEPVKLIAADKKTPLYGAVFKPSNFDSNQSYPVIDLSFIAAELNIVPKGLFYTDPIHGMFFFWAACLAELGFIVVLVDGRGSAYRDKAFIDYSYGCLTKANNTEDRIAAIQQLAKQRPYMDLDRVGFLSLGSDDGTLFRYPDFYKVGVCFAAVDTRLMAAALWGEHYENPEANTDYPRAEQLAHQLKGKLLLIHGFLDPILPVAGTLRIVDALQKANKDFDLLLMPADGHGLDTHPYTCRRAWDYLVKHLQGVEPPKEFQLASAE